MNKHFLSKLSELEDVRASEMTAEALLRMIEIFRGFILILVTGKTDKEMIQNSEKLFNRLCQLTTGNSEIEISHSMFPIEWERVHASSELRRLVMKQFKKTVVFIATEVEGLLWLAEGKKTFPNFFEYYSGVGWLRVKPILE